MKALLSLSLLFISFSIAFSQISSPGTPLSWELEMKTSNISSYNLIDFELIEHNATNRNIKQAESLVFANTYYLNKGTENAGTWKVLDDGSKIWRMIIKSEGAYSLNFTFNNFDIPEGAKVYVYNASKSNVLGAFTYQNMKNSGILPIAPVPGDEIVIEYNEPHDADYSGILNISYVGHDFLGVFSKKDGQFGVSGACNVDINCTEGNDWQIEKRAICRMVINNSNLCTGALINNAEQDATPYILSANHCVNTQYMATNTVFVFNYESPNCKGGDGIVQQSVSGAELIATKNRDQGYLDFTLLKLSTDVPLNYNPYYLGWDSRNTNSNASVCIHHPWGDVKKISVDSDPYIESSYDGFGYDPNSFWRIDRWDAGMTQGGSSGSPLINGYGRIVGSLSGGDAHDCDEEPVNDYYQKFSTAYDKYSIDNMQLKRWLDPNNTGIEVLNGFDPNNNEYEIDDVILVGNFSISDPLAFFTANEGGYVAGNNVYQDKKKAEYYNKWLWGHRDAVTAVQVAFAYASGNNSTMIELEILDDNDGVPGEVLGSSTASLRKIKENADNDWVIFKFDEPIIIDNSVYASIVLPEIEGDTVALMTIDTGIVEQNSAWELNYYNEWWPYSDANNSWDISVAHFMYLEIGKYIPLEIDQKNNTSFLLYPNPTNSEVNIQYSSLSISQRIRVIDELGRLIYESTNNSLNNGESTLDVSNWDKGMYIVQLVSDKGSVIQKLIID